MKPQLEELEPRAVPAAHHLVILDFTPDHTTADAWHPQPFMRAWQGGRSYNYTGYDCNNDGIINVKDALMAEHQIIRRMREAFNGLGWDVKGVDWNYQTNAGSRWLQRGLSDPDLLVQVVYVGDRTPPVLGPNSGLLGLGFQAAPNTNIEGFCYVFGAGVAGFPTDVQANLLGDAAAHEVGHLNGLHHPASDSDWWDLMNANATFDPRVRFSHRLKRMEDGTLQNAWQELLAGANQHSVDGSRDVYFLNSSGAF